MLPHLFLFILPVSSLETQFPFTGRPHLKSPSQKQQFSVASKPPPTQGASFDQVPTQTLSVRSTPSVIVRPKQPFNLTEYHALRHARFRAQKVRHSRGQSEGEEMHAWDDGMEWEEEEVLVPDTTDWETLRSLATMTYDTYYPPPVNGSFPPGWRDVDETWQTATSFGWDLPHLRGHVFATAGNETVIVAIKGTSTPYLDSSNTTTNDKRCDNLFFSCCCARVDWTWTPVCDCYKPAGSSSPPGTLTNAGNTCDEDCVEEAVMDEGSYYPLATELFNNLTTIYPTSQIWLVGHSLGGALAALLSITFAIPAVTFEAPSDRLAAKRLHLPLPPVQGLENTTVTQQVTSRFGAGDPNRDPLGNEDFGYAPVVHVYHTADPAPMGVCNGVLSSCTFAGLALETHCHTGKSVVFDTVGEKGWSVDVRNHRIGVVIDQVLNKEFWRPVPKNEKAKWWWPWNSDVAARNDEEGDWFPPVARPEDEDCVDCFRWTFE
ncbi:alpha/beta-hydrolase [Atractiella rhizophila]|nr:alpha/beta-hydrolase [Atractiella rhizophila]